MERFKNLIQDVVNFGSCCECGACVLVCPYGVIEYIGGKPKQTARPSAPEDFCAVSEGIGCDVCAKACPRLDLDEGELGRLLELSEASGSPYGNLEPLVVVRTKDPGILSKAQDGGFVTQFLIWALETGRIDAAVAAIADPNAPAKPIPTLLTTKADILKSAKSWYTYSPNLLALKEAKERGFQRVGFVGTPCETTPLVKLLSKDAGELQAPKKNEKQFKRQVEHLKGFAEIVALRIGLFCSEVFTFEGLMEGKITKEMGIPLERIQKFNVKGKVLIHLDSGETVTLPLKEAQALARPECAFCGDFSAEHADIVAGGVGLTGRTLAGARTALGKAWLEEALGEGLFEAWPAHAYSKSLEILDRLARKQKARSEKAYQHARGATSTQNTATSF
jgi:coenzyme F420 hydrogenase subunit beta